MTELAEFHLDAEHLRHEFPLLGHTSSESSPLIYLDTAATSQKPACVINTIQEYYAQHNANVHRGVYALSHEATIRYEACRQEVRHFIHARANEEIVFTSGATASMNCIAHGFGQSELTAGDEVVMSVMAHHSTIVPWQMACEATGASLKIIPILDNGELDLEAYRSLLSDKTKAVVLMHVSNALGTINPIQSMIKDAHKKAIPVIIDGAQAPSHVPIDVTALDCEFYTFSGHKAYGPTGVGVLYGKQAWLERLPPFHTGGDMIETVSFEKTTFNVLPHKFEAGTPNIAGVVGLSAALQFISSIGLDKIMAHEKDLLEYATSRLSAIDGLTIHGTASNKIGIISFTLQQAHPHDIATILADRGVAVRAGHHCAMPLMKRLAVPATVRASFAVHTTRSDIDRLVEAIQAVLTIFGEE